MQMILVALFLGAMGGELLLPMECIGHSRERRRGKGQTDRRVMGEEVNQANMEACGIALGPQVTALSLWEGHPEAG